ncbi:MAG: alpha/beta fold hydrolase [Cyanobacteria bacterium P01_F01_bin.150]
MVWLCVFSIFAYGALCIGLRRWQNHLIFFPDVQLKATPEAVELVYDEIRLPVGEDEHRGTIHGWWIPAHKEQSRLRQAPVILYLHGNGSNVGDLVGMGQRFHQLGWSSLLIDYRGYGLSQGAFPSENRVYEDAEAASNYLVTSLDIDPCRIVVYGHSLGGAIAIDLATRQPEMAGFIVEGSFTSMLDMAKLQSRYRLLPLDWILTQRFESLKKIQLLRSPLLFLHGTADETIPYQMSQRLQDAAQKSTHQPQSSVVLIPNAGHSDLPEVGGEDYVRTIGDFVRRVTCTSTFPLSEDDHL